MEYIVTFYNHMQATEFARKMNRMGLRTVTMPLPRSLSANCGTAVRFTTGEDVISLCRGSTLQAIYLVTPQGYQKVS